MSRGHKNTALQIALNFQTLHTKDAAFNIVGKVESLPANFL